MFDLAHEAWDLGYALDEPVVGPRLVTPDQPLVQPGFQLPAAVWKAMGACYITFFSAMAGLVGGHGFALFMVAISALYTLMYFGTGSVLARLPGIAAASPLDQGQALPTWTGPMDRGAVFAQVLIVPVAIALFGVAVMLVRWWA